MGTSQGDRAMRQRMERLDRLIQEIERFSDPQAQAHTREIVQLLLDLHGSALERILGQLSDEGERGRTLIDSLARDEVVNCLLLLYGLHPLDVETRVRQALDRVRPSLQAHGGDVELLAMTSGTLRLRLLGSCQGCSSSAVTMETTIREAIHEAAPEVTGIEVEQMEEVRAQVSSSRMALPMLVG